MLRLWEWLRKSVDRSSAAISFAEAGESEMALEFLSDGENHAAENVVESQLKNQWLLVRGVGAEFTSECMEYAVDMAKRFGWGIMALSCADTGCGSVWDRVEKKSACEKFESMSEVKVLEFRNLCRDEGLDFKHELRFMNPKDAVEDVVKCEAISFIISDDISNRNEKIEKERDLRDSLYVYSLRT